MELFEKKDISIQNLSKLGNFLFYIGLFLLPSVVFFSIILLLISSFIGTIINKNDYFKERWNIFFFSAGILIIISASFHTFTYYFLSNQITSPNLVWLDIFNWIPLFWAFWGFQPFVNNPKKRKNASLILLAGTMPVIFTGIGQFFFNWEGPYEIFFGLITWYQRPLNELGGLTGLFNNANYAGSWFNIVWPFCIASILQQTRVAKKLILISILLGILTCSILTVSKTAWLGLLINFIIVIGLKSLYFILPLIGLIILALLLVFFPTLGPNLQNLFLSKANFTWRFLHEFSTTNLWDPSINVDLIEKFPRINIWQIAIKQLSKNPIFGTGSGSFSQNFNLITGKWISHPHNLPLNLAINYGIPAAIIIIFTIMMITKRSAIKIFSLNPRKRTSEFLFEKAWFASFITLALANLLDIVYFDIRFSIVIWILLAGLKNILYEKQS